MRTKASLATKKGAPTLRAVSAKLGENWGFLLDVGIALLLCGLAASFAASDYNPYRKDWSKSTFYEHYFSDAVSLACGLGYGQLPVSEIPGLGDFLHLRRETFSCEELPANLVPEPPFPRQFLESYLHRAIGLVWSKAGVSWRALDPLLGLFCGLVSALTYMIFRLAMGRLLAIVGVAIFFPLHLVMLPAFRDYAKAPFFLAIIFILGFMAKKPLERRSLLALSATAGVLAGVGLGFRNDVLICIPPFFLVLCFLPRSSESTLRTRLASGLVFLLFLTVTYGPILLPRLSGRSSDTSAHHIRQGLDNRFTEALGIKNSLYEWSAIYSDAWPEFQAKVYALFVQGNNRQIGGVYSKEYNGVGSELVRDIFLQHPADMLQRFYAAILKIIRLPFLWVLVLLVLGARSPRFAIVLVLLTAYFAGYTALQFARRHYFHLTFADLWIVGLVMQTVGSQMCRSVLKLLRGSTRADWSGELQQLSRFWTDARKRVPALALAGLVVVFLPLYGFRAYQHQNLGKLLEEYSQADLEELEMRIVEYDEDMVLVEGLYSDRLVRLPSSRHHLLAGYLVADFSLEGCSKATFDVTIRYETARNHDFSRTLHVRLLQDGVTRIYTPIYSRASTHYGDKSLFKGIEIPRTAVACIKALYQILDLSSFPPILQLNMPADWKDLKLYQTLEKRNGWKEFYRSIDTSRGRWRKIGRHVSRLHRSASR